MDGGALYGGLLGLVLVAASGGVRLRLRHPGVPGLAEQLDHGGVPHGGLNREKPWQRRMRRGFGAAGHPPGTLGSGRPDVLVVAHGASSGEGGSTLHA
ncbi:hypothetical protein GCM10010433_31870 [Streptomyces pulveraceus]